MRTSVQLLLAAVVCAASVARAADAPEKTFALTIERGTVAAEQRTIKVGKGDALRVRITSDAPGELHLHGYRLAAKLAPGQPSELAFKAHATGRYPFEWHSVDKTTHSGTHRGPPLATLEVRPQ